MPIQLPNDAASVGYKEVRPYHHEQIFSSEQAASALSGCSQFLITY